jgi:predicted ATP-grasp superfamily ATP-dependent carboligase
MDVNIVILGASVRGAAQSAIRAGMSPYGIDLFADEDLRAVCPANRIDRYPSEFLRALAAAPQVPWIYTGGLESYPRLLARLAAVCPLWGNGPEVCRRVRDPHALYGVLKYADFLTPQLIVPWASPPPAARASDSHCFVVKPLRGSGGLGVRWAKTADLLHHPSQKSVLQRFVAGEAASAVYVAANGRAELLGATRQLLGRDVGLPTEFAYAGTIAPLMVSPEEMQALHRLGGVLAREFGLVGLFGVDFVRSQGDLWVIEVNPRYTASVEVLERVHVLPFLAAHVAACTRGTLPADLPPHENPANETCAGKLIVYARRKVVIPQGSLGADLADIPAAGQAIEPGHPIATVFAAGYSHDEVFERLRARADTLHARLESPPASANT